MNQINWLIQVSMYNPGGQRAALENLIDKLVEAENGQ